MDKPSATVSVKILSLEDIAQVDTSQCQTFAQVRQAIEEQHDEVPRFRFVDISNRKFISKEDTAKLSKHPNWAVTTKHFSSLYADTLVSSDKAVNSGKNCKTFATRWMVSIGTQICTYLFKLEFRHGESGGCGDQNATL